VSKIATLEADADAKRSRLEHTLRRIEKQATVLRLVDDVIARNGAPNSSEIAQALRRNPLLAASLVLLVGLIALEVTRARKVRSINRRDGQSVVPARKIPTPSHETQETYHGR
jgi:hypothetical protein